PPTQCPSEGPHANRAGRHHHPCSSHLQVTLLDRVQHLLVETLDDDALPAAIKAVVPELVRPRFPEGTVGSVDALPAVRRGKHLCFRVPRCPRDGLPNIDMYRVV